MRTSIIWWLLPDELLPLVVVGVALLVIVRVFRLSTGIGILFSLFILPMLLAPIIEMVMAALPFWLVLLMCAALAMSLLRGCVALFLGNGATDRLVGNIATDCVRGFARLCLLPFRMVGAAFRMVLNARRL